MRWLGIDTVIAAWYVAVEMDKLGEAREQTRRYFDASSARLLLVDRESGGMQNVHGGGVMEVLDRHDLERYFRQYPQAEKAVLLPAEQRSASREESVSTNITSRIPGYTLVGMVCEYEGGQVLLEVVRTSERRPFCHGDVRQLDCMVGQLRHAIQQWLALSHYRNTASLMGRVFDALEIGMAVVDGDGRLRATNTVAKACLRQADGLVSRNGRIATTDVSSQARLACLLATATDQDTRGGGLVVRGRAGTPLMISVLPLCATRNWPDSILTERLALVRMDYPMMAVGPDPSALSALFGLTLRETELAQALLDGKTLEEYAKVAGVGYGTVRSQLRAVFSKTGVRRQAELVRLLGRIPGSRPTD